MFDFLKGKEQKLLDALQQGDLDKLGPLLNRFDAEAVNSPLQDGMSIVELAIRAQQSKALALILSKGGDATANSSAQQPLTVLALQQQESLSLLSVLLAAGADADGTDSNGNTLLALCVAHCNEAQLPLHLSRLQQHGADLNSEPELLINALRAFNQPLIQFLINSGCELPALPDDLPEQALTYARRLQDDYRIQQQFLGR